MNVVSPKLRRTMTPNLRPCHEEAKTKASQKRNPAIKKKLVRKQMPNRTFIKHLLLLQQPKAKEGLTIMPWG